MFITAFTIAGHLSYPEADQFSPCPPSHFLKINCNIILPSKSVLQVVSFPKVCPLNPCSACPVSHAYHRPCPLFILYFVTWLILASSADHKALFYIVVSTLLLHPTS